MAVKFEGLEDLLNTFEELADSRAVTPYIQKACALVEGEAKKKAPKGDGALRRSITSKVDVMGGDIVGVVFTPLEYAPYVEYGTGLFAEEGGREDVPWRYQDDKGEWHTTSGMKPRPFMSTALNENREKIKTILKGAYKID